MERGLRGEERSGIGPGRLLVGALLIFGAFVAVKSFPDLRRYLRMHRM